MPVKRLLINSISISPNNWTYKRLLDLILSSFPLLVGKEEIFNDKLLNGLSRVSHVYVSGHLMLQYPVSMWIISWSINLKLIIRIISIFSPSYLEFNFIFITWALKPRICVWANLHTGKSLHFSSLSYLFYYLFNSLSQYNHLSIVTAMQYCNLKN